MTYNTQRVGFWESLRDVPSRMSLRLKLITAVLVLVGLALAVTTLVGNAILKNYLLSPTDSSMVNAFQANPANPNNESWATRYVVSYLSNGGQHTSTGLALDWVANGKINSVIFPASAAIGGAGGPFNFPTPPQMPGPALQTSASWLVAHSGKPFTLPAQTGDDQWRVLMEPAEFSGANGTTVAGTVVLAVDVTSVYKTTGHLATIDLLVGLSVLVLLGLVGVVVIRTSLRPLAEIEETAGAIAAGDLTRRVPDRDPNTEVGRLGHSLNVMLSQIEEAFDAQSQSEDSARRSEARMRQFLGDASHELRTPLTAIRGFAEYYRQRGGVHAADVADVADKDAAAAAGPNGKGQLTQADLDRIMRRLEQESARMGVLVEDMLLLARLDQQRPLDESTVDLLTLAADAVHDARMVAPDRAINLTVGSGAALLVNGDEVRLRQVIGNLMSNALSHTPAGTPIDVHIRSGNMAEIQSATASPDDAADLGPQAWHGAHTTTPAAVLEITDHGPGLTQEQAAHVFERFYRADAARTTGGTGLGLAIVAALVAAHRGAVWVRTQPGQGATFSIALPLTAEAIHETGSDDDLDDLADQPENAHVPGVDWVESSAHGPAPGSTT
jgi:two-component system OmpR family sensor kinase